jgi:hypothetical protein
MNMQQELRTAYEEVERGLYHGCPASSKGVVMSTFTAVHVVLSLLGIATGLVVLVGFMTQRWLDPWNSAFLVTTALTSATGFGFPFERLLPSHVVGALSLAVLALAAFARYARHLGGGWKRTYVISAVVALYFNVFVLVVQAFLKVPTLHALAPTQTEPPFAIAQLAVLLLFAASGIVAFMQSKRWMVLSEPGGQSYSQS